MAIAAGGILLSFKSAVTERLRFGSEAWYLKGLPAGKGQPQNSRAKLRSAGGRQSYDGSLPVRAQLFLTGSKMPLRYNTACHHIKQNLACVKQCVPATTCMWTK